MSRSVFAHLRLARVVSWIISPLRAASLAWFFSVLPATFARAASRTPQRTIVPVATLLSQPVSRTQGPVYHLPASPAYFLARARNRITGGVPYTASSVELLHCSVSCNCGRRLTHRFLCATGCVSYTASRKPPAEVLLAASPVASGCISRLASRMVLGGVLCTATFVPQRGLPGAASYAPPAGVSSVVSFAPPDRFSCLASLTP